MLTTNITGDIDPTGVDSSSMRPINDGVEVNVVNESGSSTGWGLLDNILTSVGNGLSTVIETAAEVRVNELRTGSEATQTNAGDPYDTPGNENYVSSFTSRYGIPIAVGLAATFAAVMLYKRLK